MTRLQPARRGFTLVELLVVIAIIGILAALITVAAYNAVIAGKETRQKLEVEALVMAIERYKSEFGAYPPDFSDQAALVRHVYKRFPRFVYDQANPRGIIPPPNAGQLTRAQALVFWLGKFNSDPYNPFNFYPINGSTDATFNDRITMTTPLFDFVEDRLRSEDPATYQEYWELNANAPKDMYVQDVDQKYKAMPVFLAAFGDAGLAPYVYFDARSSYYRNKQTITPSPYYFRGMAGVAVPYADDANKNGTADAGESYVARDKFQIICAGMDGLYSQEVGSLSDAKTLRATLRLFPVGAGYDTSESNADNDNCVSFTTERTLEDAKP